jgi:tRNA pseudouridine synthase 10
VKARVQGELQAHGLCKLCAERQGEGTPGVTAVSGPGCEICGGLMDGVSAMGRLAVKGMRPYEFRTFGVGVTLPGRIQESEDELRSSLRLKGRETAKAQAARLIGSFVSGSVRKRLDRVRPDLTVLANFEKGEAYVASRPVYFYGRYTKPRGVAQRRSFCETCRGSGCEKCRGTGYERRQSVEEALRKKLQKYSGSTKIVFTWLGSEDRESRVFPPGRPFVAEIKSPRRRRLPKKFGVKVRAGVVSVTRGRALPSKPLRLPAFRFETEIRAKAAAKPDPDLVSELKSAFRRATVTFHRPNNRPATKMVYRASATARGRDLLIRAELDGGLPVKRFVSGELVSPSVSEVLKTEVGCRCFDIHGVREIGGFRFAEITRNAEKN